MCTICLLIDQMLLAGAMIVSHDRIDDQQCRGIVGSIDHAAREIHGSGRCTDRSRESGGSGP